MDFNRIEYLGLARVLKRGTGEIHAESDRLMLVRDSASGASMLACEDPEAGLALLDRFAGRDCKLLMISDCGLGKAAFERYGFSEKIECFQLAYYGEEPADDTGLTVRPAGESDLPMLIENYDLVSPEELAQIVRRQKMLLGYDGERLIGFMGEHLEGSMGLLYVFPEYRHKGFGAALQRHLMARTMEEGFVPFGQVEKDNLASLRLQEKLGMTQSERLIVWMWK